MPATESTLLGWRAWYADGQVYQHTAPQAFRLCPERGVIVVVCYHTTGRTLYDGADWYGFDETGAFRFVPSQAWGTTQPRPAGCTSCQKQGVALPDADYHRILTQAQVAVWP